LSGLVFVGPRPFRISLPRASSPYFVFFRVSFSSRIPTLYQYLSQIGGPFHPLFIFLSLPLFFSLPLFSSFFSFLLLASFLFCFFPFFFLLPPFFFFRPIGVSLAQAMLVLGVDVFFLSKILGGAMEYKLAFGIGRAGCDFFVFGQTEPSGLFFAFVWGITFEGCIEVVALIFMCLGVVVTTFIVPIVVLDFITITSFSLTQSCIDFFSRRLILFSGTLFQWFRLVSCSNSFPPLLDILYFFVVFSVFQLHYCDITFYVRPSRPRSLSFEGW